MMPAMACSVRSNPTLLGAWSRLSVRGYRAVHQFGVVSADLLVAEPEARHHAGPIVLNEYVSCADQIAGALDMVRVLEVECHRSLVPVQGSEVLAEPVGQRRPALVSPPLGCSTLMTFAPISARSIPQKGPAATLQNSMTSTPLKGSTALSTSKFRTAAHRQ